jgi:DNA-binding winged helix-turn-helix (wHTH) protein/tetratricopeptide (TPR) repeat protein
MSERDKTTYTFGEFQLIPSEKTLFRKGQKVNLTRRGFAILCLLVEKKHELVTKAEVLERIWGSDVHVEEANIQVQVSAIRRALHDTDEKLIQTVHGEGYRFAADVAESSNSPEHRRASALRLVLAGFAFFLSVSATGAWLYNTRRIGTGKHGHDLTWRIVSNVPLIAKQRYELALNYELRGDDEEALTALKQATDTAPDFGEAYLECALLSEELERQDEARKYLQQAEQSFSYHDDYIKLKGEALKAELDLPYEEALRQYRLLVDSYPYDTSAKYYLADLALEHRAHFDEASEMLNACLRLEPLDPYCNFDKMILEVEQSRFDEAISTYHRLTKAGVDYAWLYEPLGLAFYGQGNFGEALNALNKLSRTGKTHGLVHLMTAQEWTADIDLFQGKVQAGKRLVEELAASDSAYERATHLIYLANTDLLLGNKSEAKRDVMEAITRYSGSDVLVDAARVLASIGDRDETTKLLKQIREKQIDVGPASQHFIAGTLAISNGKIADGIAELQAADRIDEDALTEYLLAQALVSARDWASAISLLTNLEGSKGWVISDDGSLPIIWPLSEYLLAVANDRAGNEKEAVASYSKFISNWPSADGDLTQLRDAKRRFSILNGSN